MSKSNDSSDGCLPAIILLVAAMAFSWLASTAFIRIQRIEDTLHLPRMRPADIWHYNQNKPTP